MTEQLSAERLERVLKGISVPPQPQILVDLQMEQVMPDPDLREIARLISKDVGLSGSVLKTVNSPAFARREEVTSIQQAVMMLGLNTIINLVNAVVLRNEMNAKGTLSDEQVAALTRFWDSAGDTAQAAATVARQIGFAQPDQAYMLGLFHNSGIPLLVERFDGYLDVLREAYAQDGGIADYENSRLDTNHAVLGFYVAKSWKMPSEVSEAIAMHHRADVIFGDQNIKDNKRNHLLAILKIAEHLAGLHRVLGGAEQDKEWERIGTSVLEYLGIGSYDLDEIRGECSDLGIGGQVALV